MGIKPITEIEEHERKQKQEILKIAYETVMKNEDLQIRRLADASNTYVPLIYKLFRGKSGLIHEVSIKISETIQEKLQYNIKNHRHPFLQLTQYGVNYINCFKDYPQLSRFITDFQSTFSNRYSTAPESILQYKITLGSSIKILKNIISDVCDLLYTDQDMSHEDKEDYVNKRAVQLWGTIHGLSMLATNIDLLAENNTISHLKEHIIDVFFGIKDTFAEDIDEILSFETLEQATDIITTLHL